MLWRSLVWNKLNVLTERPPACRNIKSQNMDNIIPFVQHMSVCDHKCINTLKRACKFTYQLILLAFNIGFLKSQVQLFFFMGLCPLHCSMTTSTLSLYPLDTSSTSNSQVMTVKNVFRHCCTFGGGKITSNWEHCYSEWSRGNGLWGESR